MVRCGGRDNGGGAGEMTVGGEELEEQKHSGQEYEEPEDSNEIVKEDVEMVVALGWWGFGARFCGVSNPLVGGEDILGGGLVCSGLSGCGGCCGGSGCDIPHHLLGLQCVVTPNPQAGAEPSRTISLTSRLIRGSRVSCSALSPHIRCLPIC